MATSIKVMTARTMQPTNFFISIIAMMIAIIAIIYSFIFLIHYYIRPQR